MGDSYDHAIVGAGSAGCVLAGPRSADADGAEIPSANANAATLMIEWRGAEVIRTAG